MQDLHKDRRDHNLPFLKCSPRLADYRDEYFKFYESVKDAKRPKTFRSERYARKGWLKHLGEIRLNEITRAHLNGYMAKQQAAGIKPRNACAKKFSISPISLRRIMYSAEKFAMPLRVTRKYAGLWFRSFAIICILSAVSGNGHGCACASCGAGLDAVFPAGKFMSEEIFDIVNERDEVVGQNTRREAHRLGLRHRAVHVLVFNARGEVFLQKRSLKKDTAAGKWDSSASGHLDSGEAYDACAVRELREEIALELPAQTAPGASQPLRRLFKIDACQETGWEFCWVYRCESEGPFELHPDEIEKGHWFAPAAVTKWVNEKPQDFASAFVLIWEKFLTADEHGFIRRVG